MCLYKVQISQYVILPESVIQPFPVDDHVQGFPSSASFCLAVLGIPATVAKGVDHRALNERHKQR